MRQAVIDEGVKLSSIFVASVQGQTLLDLSKEKADQGYYVFIDSAGVDNQSTRSALVRSDYVLMALPLPRWICGSSARCSRR